MEREVGVGRCKLHYMEEVINKTLLCGTENYIQCPIISHNGKKYIKKSMCVYIYMELKHFAVQQKLTQHCKSTILQLKN